MSITALISLVILCPNNEALNTTVLGKLTNRKDLQEISRADGKYNKYDSYLPDNGTYSFGAVNNCDFKHNGSSHLLTTICKCTLQTQAKQPYMFNGQVIKDSDIEILGVAPDGTIYIPAIDKDTVASLWKLDSGFSQIPVTAKSVVTFQSHSDSKIFVSKSENAVAETKIIAVPLNARKLTLGIIGNGDISNSSASLYVSFGHGNSQLWASSGPESKTEVRNVEWLIEPIVKAANGRPITAKIVVSTNGYVIGVGEATNLSVPKTEGASFSVPQNLEDLNASLLLKKSLSSVCIKYSVPGSVIAVLSNGQLTAYASFGQKQSNSIEKVSADTPFVFGSMTQTILGLLLTRLVDKGIVTINEPFGRIFPELSDSMSNTLKNSNLYDIATCASGLPGGMNFDEMNSRWHLPPKNARYELLSKYLIHLPESAVSELTDSHGGPNWYALACALERKTGKSLESLIKDELCTPLRLTEFGFDVPIDMEGKLFGIGGHIRDTNGKVRPSNFVLRSRVGFYGSIIDLAKIVNAMLPPSQGGSRFLSNASWDLLYRKNPRSPFAPIGRVSPSGEVYMAGDTGTEYANIFINSKKTKSIIGCMNLRGKSGGYDAMMSILNMLK